MSTKREPQFRFTKIGFTIFILGLIIGAILEYAHSNAELLNALDAQRPIRAKTSYAFINPLLGYDSPEAASEFREYGELEEKFSERIDSAKKNGEASRVSLYFRDLQFGRWVGINENEGYEPASMLKVVVMIAYLKEAEHDPSLLDRTFTFTKDIQSALEAVPYQASSELVIGRSYSVRTLIDKMITDSDNGAKNLLLMHANAEAIHNTYSDLGIPNPDDMKGDYTISTKAYSLFLRVLYNATYLSRDMSELALKTLANATYGDGIVAGLPSGTRVAQKFGEHVFVDTNNNPTGIALSNCGVIYAPAHPYILCVMTQGAELNKLSNVIRDLSKIAYDADINDPNQ